MIQSIDEDPTPPNVSDLVKRAGASRPTFYQHFGDIPTLMHEAAMHRLEHVFESLPEPKPGAMWKDFATTNFETLFLHLTEHRDFYLAIVHGPSGVKALDRLVAFLAGRLITVSPMKERIRERTLNHTNISKDAPERFAQFLAAGLISVAISDLENEAPVPHMVRTSSQFLLMVTGQRA